MPLEVEALEERVPSRDVLDTPYPAVRGFVKGPLLNETTPEWLKLTSSPSVESEKRSPGRGVGVGDGDGLRLGVRELRPERVPEGVMREPEFRRRGFGPRLGVSTLGDPLNAAKAACSGFFVLPSEAADNGELGRWDKSGLVTVWPGLKMDPITLSRAARKCEGFAGGE